MTPLMTKFRIITNGLASLGDDIDNDQKVRKIIRALPPSVRARKIERGFAVKFPWIN